jgi:DNA-binding MarR family transcriptional regulator
MEEKNLIRRSANPDDKRVVLIHLTEDGKKYRDTSREVVIRLNQYLREHLEAEEVEVFFNVAKKINGLLDSPDIYELESELNSSEK